MVRRAGPELSIGYGRGVDVAVVIAAHDEAESIEAAIAGALVPGVDVVVAVAEGADDTALRARKAGARVVSSPPGRAQQLALGAEVTAGDIVLFLHADTHLPSGWASAVRDALRDPQVVGGAFRFRFDCHGARLRIVEWGARLRVALFCMPYGDQALFVRRSVLDAIGGVPLAPIMEDLDLVSAMRRRGRIARLALPATTSARRYLAGGVFRTMLRNWVAATGWMLGVDRGRLARWYRR